MSKTLVGLIALIVGTTLMLFPLQDAEAKRMGGGGSFGSKSSYGQKYQRNVDQAPQGKTTPATTGQSRGFGGMLGGLAMGGLLAALFMGGAFENINFFDILILGVIAFVLFKLFARRRSILAPPATSQPMQATASGQDAARGFDTDIMFKGNASNTAPSQALHAGTMTDAPVYEAPKEFNQSEFLNGANAAYRMLQQAWDDGELAEIRGLVTDKVFAEIQQQMQSRQGDNRTEILSLESRLLEIRTVAGVIEATVMFDALMREIDAERDETQRPEQIKEVWHFIKPVNGVQPTWYLDGIQQLS